MDADYIRSRINYDPNTGVATWKTHRMSNMVGKPVGSISDKGYYRVYICGKQIGVHRLIWLHQKGYLPEFVDHIDHDRSNNKWSNLREVTRTENARNKTTSKANTTGYTGVYAERGKFRAIIGHKGKAKSLGSFKTIEEAVAARKKAENDLGYHVNHGN